MTLLLLTKGESVRLCGFIDKANARKFAEYTRAKCMRFWGLNLQENACDECGLTAGAVRDGIGLGFRVCQAENLTMPALSLSLSPGAFSFIMNLLFGFSDRFARVQRGIYSRYNVVLPKPFKNNFSPSGCLALLPIYQGILGQLLDQWQYNHCVKP